MRELTFPPGGVAGQSNQFVGQEPLLDTMATTGTLLQVAVLAGDQAHPAAEVSHARLTLLLFCPLGLGLQLWPVPKAVL